MIRRALSFALLALEAVAQSRTATVNVSVDKKLGPLEIDRIALGQGGLSEDPIWEERAVEIRALQPRIIRLFVQEYFDLMPEKGRYNFSSLDRSVDLIRKAGAIPLLSIDFKPKVLFPVIDQDIVEPNDYGAWEELISALVRHYKERGSGIKYWEVANEPDIGEDGGCPYRFKPDSYTRYYKHTVEAILRADSEARVGGPALANWKSPILPALLEFCASGKAPLHFVSWHTYTNSPASVRGTIEGVKAMLAKFPSLKPETILNEWNMSLRNPPQDARFQPAFILETAWQMKDAGLDYSCYYHIRDYHVDPRKFSQFMSQKGTASMARWWNRMPQYDGLFDYQNTMRPSYFAFKLLARMGGERLGLESSDSTVHGFATYDPEYHSYNVLLWNFADTNVNVKLSITGLKGRYRGERRSLDALTPSNDENARLRPLQPIAPVSGAMNAETMLAPYGIEYWSIEESIR
jgi:hypothetical protein